MQIIFAEIFVPQDFTIRLRLSSVDPKTCVKRESIEEEKTVLVIRSQILKKISFFHKSETILTKQVFPKLNFCFLF